MASSLSEPDPITKLTPQDVSKVILKRAVAGHFDVLSAVRSVADQDPSQRKLFIRGLGWDTTTDRLRSLFLVYGELEEAMVILDKATGKSKGLVWGNSRGSFGFDKQRGKSRGFAVFVYKKAEGAEAALVEPVKNIDGRKMKCKLTIERRKGKRGQDGMMPSEGGAPRNAEMGIGGHGGGYGGPGGPGGYGGFSSGPGDRYGAGLGGPYGGYGGAGGGSSLYGLPPTSVGMPSGGYLESAHYSLSSSGAFPSQHFQGAGTSPVRRVPPGEMNPDGPPFY
ncbi:hypothetical protein PTKIN_Ptkin02bG0044800 [Pterospermum kingtungense]